MRYVVAVADHGSFQRAAAALHIAQPPLSRQIRDLERELGVRLFERRPTRLTEPGRVFVDSARRVLQAADGAVADTVRAGRGEVCRLRLGYGITTAYEFLPALVAALRPGIDVETQEVWADELVDGLLSGRFDAGIARCISDHPGITREVVRRERLVAVVGPTHRLAGRSSVQLTDFAGDSFRFFPRRLDPGYYDVIVGALNGRFEIWPNPVPGLRHLSIRDGTGFTLLPESVRLPGVVPIPVVDDLPSVDVEILWTRATAAVEALRATARAAAPSAV